MGETEAARRSSAGTFTLNDLMVVERMCGEVRDMAVWPYSCLGGAERAGIAMLHRHIRHAWRNHQAL